MMRRASFCILNSALCLLLLSSCVYWTPMSRRATAGAKVIGEVPVQKWDIESCGAGSLSTVLQHYGDPTTMDEWDRILPRTRGGVLSIDMVLAARQKGYDARLITGSKESVERELLDGRPVLLMLQVIQYPGKAYDFFHYIVVDGIDTTAKLVRVQFGDGKLRWVKFSRFEGAWAGAGHAQIIIGPKDPASDALRAAVALEDAGDFTAAADAYRRIITGHPSSTVAWTNLGNAEVRLGNKAKAEEAFRKALEIDSTAADALNNLAWLLYQDQRLDEAEQIANRAVAATAPDSWMRFDTLARIQLARGQCRNALQSWERALKDVPATSRAEMSKAAADARTNCRT